MYTEIRFNSMYKCMKSMSYKLSTLCIKRFFNSVPNLLAPGHSGIQQTMIDHHPIGIKHNESGQYTYACACIFQFNDTCSDLGR